MKKDFFLKNKFASILLLSLVMIIITTIILIPEPGSPENHDYNSLSDEPEATQSISEPQHKDPSDSQNNKNNKDNKNNKYIALTFDDGPHSTNTPRLIEILNKYNVNATFFVLGHLVNRYPGIVKNAYENGNEIGIHSYDHKNYFSIKKKAIKSQQKRTSKAIFNATGHHPYFTRVPYGNWNKDISKLIRQPIILWSVDPNDWKSKKKPVIKSVIKNTRTGSIILMHDIYSSTVDAAEIIIKRLQKKGYTFVTVSEMIEHYTDSSPETNKIYYSKDYVVKAYSHKELTEKNKKNEGDGKNGNNNDNSENPDEP